jgi:hypothetical protein
MRLRVGYAQRLRDKGVARHQAEAHAEAARDFIMAELFTKADAIPLRQDIDLLKQSIDARFAVIESKLETLGLRLTVRLGAMLAAVVAVLAALQKLS